MSRDRINELKGTGFQLNPELYDGGSDDAFQLAPISDTRFVQDINDLEYQLQKAKENVGHIKQLYSKCLTNVNQAKAADNHKMLEDLTTETSYIFRIVGKKLKEFDYETKNMSAGNKNVPIRKSQQRKLANELKLAIQEYTTIQKEYKEKYFERMKRQYRIVKQDATDEDIEKALEDPNNQIFAQQLVSSKLVNSQNALLEAREKHNDIKRIEASISELVTIFQDMETLLLAQSDTLIRIEDTVDQAQADVNQASEEMVKAIEIRKKSRKRLWIITIIVGIILLLIFLWIYFTFISPAVNSVKSAVS